MAGDSLLEALVRNQYRVENDPFAASGGAIASALPSLVNPYASTGRNALYTVGAGLVAGLLGGYGRREVEKQNAELYGQAQNLIGTRDPVERRQIVEQYPRLADFGTTLLDREYALDEAVRQNQLEAQATREDLRLKTLYENYPQLALREEIPQAGIPGSSFDSSNFSPDAVVPSYTPPEVGALTVDAITGDAEGRGLNPLQFNPVSELTGKQQMELRRRILEEKALADAEAKRLGYDPDITGMYDALRTDLTASPEYKDFSNVLKAAKAIQGALKDRGSVTDLELVRYAILMIEPGMAIREGEQAAVLATPSIPEQLKGQALKALKGESALTPAVREQLQRLALRAYTSQQESYDKVSNFYLKEAETRGLDPSRINPLGASLPPDSIFTPLGDPVGDAGDAETFLLDLLRKGFTKEEARTLYQKRFGDGG